MAEPKFSVKDKVIINKRAPKEVRVGLRANRQRTITDIYYDPEKQCRYF